MKELLKALENEHKKSKIIKKVIDESIYKIIVGGRNGHKSTEMQIYLLYMFCSLGYQFLLIRRKINNNISNYFSTYTIEFLKKYDFTIEFKKKIKDGEKYTGYFYLKDLKNNVSYLIGKCVFLSVEQSYRSNEIPELSNIKIAVNEECICKQDNEYLTDEIQLTLDVISTFARNNNCNVFFIGNTNKGQKSNPITHYFECDDKEIIKGKKLTYTPTNCDYKVSFYYAPNLESVKDYEKINNTYNEWENDKRYLNIDIENYNTTFLNYILVFRNTKYFLYKIKDEKTTYYYFSSQVLNNIFKYPSNKNEFIKTIPLNHQNYNNDLLSVIYPDFFNFETKKFIDKNNYKDIKTIIIDSKENEITKLKENHYIYLFKIFELIKTTPFFSNSQGLIYFLKRNLKKYIKESEL